MPKPLDVTGGSISRRNYHGRIINEGESRGMYPGYPLRPIHLQELDPMVETQSLLGLSGISEKRGF
jgi:hypothetical protein